MDFVTAATNIRAHNFQISMETLFKVKEMAGKIVPAISSSNALVAALQVMEAVKLLAGDAKKDQLKAISYQRTGGLTRLTSMSRINEKPKVDCTVCSDDSGSIATVTVRSFEECKFADFIEKILPDCLMVKPDGELLIDMDGKILFERCEDMSDDEASLYTKRLAKSLVEMGFKQHSMVMLTADTVERASCTIHV